MSLPIEQIRAVRKALRQAILYVGMARGRPGVSNDLDTSLAVIGAGLESSDRSLTRAVADAVLAPPADVEPPSSGTDGPDYNAGRAEGRADVAASLRSIVDPDGVLHLSLDGVLAHVQDLMDAESSLPPRLSAECAELEDLEACPGNCFGGCPSCQPADLEDVAARVEAQLPPATRNVNPRDLSTSCRNCGGPPGHPCSIRCEADRMGTSVEVIQAQRQATEALLPPATVLSSTVVRLRCKAHDMIGCAGCDGMPPGFFVAEVDPVFKSDHRTGCICVACEVTP